MEDWEKDFKRKEIVYDRFAYANKSGQSSSRRLVNSGRAHSNKGHSHHKVHSNRVNYESESHSSGEKVQKVHSKGACKQKSSFVSKYFNGKVFDVSNFISSWNRPPITSQDLLKDDVTDYFSCRRDSLQLSNNLRGVIGLDDESRNESRDNNWKPPEQFGLDNSLPIITRTIRNEKNDEEATCVTVSEKSNEYSKFSIQQFADDNDSPNLESSKSRSEKLDDSEDYNCLSSEITGKLTQNVTPKTVKTKSRLRRNADVEFINSFVNRNRELVEITCHLNDINHRAPFPLRDLSNQSPVLSIDEVVKAVPVIRMSNEELIVNEHQSNEENITFTQKLPALYLEQRNADNDSNQISFSLELPSLTEDEHNLHKDSNITPARPETSPSSKHLTYNRYSTCSILSPRRLSSPSESN